MQSTRTLLLIATMAGALGAQTTTIMRPVLSTGTLRVAGTDLVVDSIDLVIPRMLGTGAVAEDGRVTTEGLKVRVRVTNRGSERWAERGEVGVTLTAGKVGDEVRPRRAGDGGVSVAKETNDISRVMVAPFGPFRARGSILGSLAPGESRMITATMTTSVDGSRMFFERDKYYTVIATIRAGGQSNAANDRSQRVGRIDAFHRGLIVRWEPLEILTATAGTVEVAAPPGRRP